MYGKLYIIATPIGNLDDISYRAITILNDLDIIACEDTRITKRLLNKYKIKTKTMIYNDVNSFRIKDKILDLLFKGQNIGLVTDAGTPCISDPGYRLVNLAHKNNINVYTIPGPSSVQAALSISGLPTDAYYFQGFLPKKKGRQTRFNYLSELDCTIVIFESPKRIKKTLKDIEYYLGNRIISICKELTKIYENVTIGDVNDLMEKYESINIKGEHVIMIAKKNYKY